MAGSVVSRLSVLEKLLAVSSAVLTLGTGFLAYKTATISQAKDQVQANADQHAASLQADYEALLAENARLKVQLGLPVTSVSPEISIRHHGSLVLAVGNYADLDSPSSDPQWSTGGTDIGYATGAVNIKCCASELYLKNKKANYGTCRNATGYSALSLNTSRLAPGKYICVKTGEKRYSALRITQLDSAKIAFYVVTYDPPDN